MALVTLSARCFEWKIVTIVKYVFSFAVVVGNDEFCIRILLFLRYSPEIDAVKYQRYEGVNGLWIVKLENRVRIYKLRRVKQVSLIDRIRKCLETRISTQ